MIPYGQKQFQSLDAKLKQALTLYNDGNPPFPGFIWDEDAMHWTSDDPADWDFFVSNSAPKTAGTSLPPMQQQAPGRVHIMLDGLGKILAVHRDRTRADRDAALIHKAGGGEIEIQEHEVE